MLHYEFALGGAAVDFDLLLFATEEGEMPGLDEAVVADGSEQCDGAFRVGVLAVASNLDEAGDHLLAGILIGE